MSNYNNIFLTSLFFSSNKEIIDQHINFSMHGQYLDSFLPIKIQSDTTKRINCMRKKIFDHPASYDCSKTTMHAFIAYSSFTGHYIQKMQ